MEQHNLGPQNDEEELIFAQESIIFDFQEKLCSAMDALGWDEHDLAKAMEVPPEEVKKLLRHDADPTLRQIVRIFHTIGKGNKDV